MGIYTSYYNESSGAAFNAVLDVSFSEEDHIEPITREMAKTWCAIDSVQHDIIIDQVIKAARDICERYINQSILNRTVTATLNNRCGNSYLPYGPVKTIAGVVNSVGTTLELTSQYDVSGASFKRLLWPLEDNITITYSAGYECLPGGIKLGILCQIAYMYENRGDETGIKAQLSPMAKGHLRPFRMV